ncbi:MAG: dimethylarginine dimethylaminohydrolase family protein [Alphaproteobacteria bacterium]
MTGLNEYGPLRRVALRHPRAAFGGPEVIAGSWRELNYLAAPDYGRALADFDRFAEILSASGAQIDWLPVAEGLTLDSLYVHDAAVPGPRGVVLCNMGKPTRAGEPAAMGTAFEGLGLPIAGRIEGDGRLEGGDLVWFDEGTCAVARGYRTNDEGIAQLAALLGPGVEVVTVPLPHYRGPDDVFHLMSIISPLDADLALVHSPLMPVPFREWLLVRGIELVEVAEDELDSLGCNVLALAPRRCLTAAGNPKTRRRLEAAGCEVLTYPAEEISLKGQGGPTCLTRPLVRG